MQPERFLYLMEHPEDGKEEDIQMLSDLENQFPFSANLAITKTLILHQQQSEEFMNSLENAASKTLSRSKLKQLIEGPIILDLDWMEIPKGEEIQLEEIVPVADPIPEIEVATEISLEKNTEPVEIQEETPRVISDLPPGKNPFAFSYVKVGKAKIETGRTKIPASNSYELKENLKSAKPKKNQNNLIDRFLETSPSISPPSIDFGNQETKDLASSSSVLEEEIITENMAMIYLKQKNYPKALAIYRKLQLKFPEKDSYFAALIKNLETTIL
jgi:hypothetical protein